jgi:hypothetical protein
MDPRMGSSGTRDTGFPKENLVLQGRTTKAQQREISKSETLAKRLS